MTKAPKLDQVQMIMLRKRINEKVDLSVATAKKHNQPRFDVAMLDKVFRPFCIEVQTERYSQGDPDEISDAVCAATANMMVELILNVIPKGDAISPQAVQAKAAFDAANLMIGKVAEYLSRGVMLNYGQDHLTPDAPSVKIESQPPQRKQ